ncbi:NmrA family NAD(P)-binding protein [Mesorhizobium sp.]|uniref:NmrA family NAD(P)-binding protein n=1 Tax=Mesorhizobium sp. TaxID=1871066 RepID=UPI000FE4BDBA|nr:NmrA family NAD(P)-binding protein [Mesorhizobium sp.]RWD69813.1 MAG: NAD-dependent epimerase/dehydratase family protein [Mesorhizobium sp.]
MSKRVLLIGATGRMGSHFVDALCAKGHEVAALVRASQEAAGPRRAQRLAVMKDKGIDVVTGELADQDLLDRLAAGVDAIISCVDHRPDHLQAQANLAVAASRSDRVCRIVPSQFGIDSRLYGKARVEHGDVKRAMQEAFVTSGKPVTFVHTNGLAGEWVGSLGQLGLTSPPESAVEIYGNGAVPFSTVAPEDVAALVTEALFDDRAAGRHVAIIPPDNLLTQEQLVSAWEERTGRSLRRITVSPAALDARIEALAGDPAARPRLAMAQLVRAAWIDGLGDGRRLPDVLELTELYPQLAYVRSRDFLAYYDMAGSPAKAAGRS